jgi:hypothetical protein
MTRLLIAMASVFSFMTSGQSIGQSADRPRPSAASQVVSPQERQALVALYEATDGSHWKDREGWLGSPGTECGWYGVSCGGRIPAVGEPTTVTALELGENNLRGTIAAAIDQFTHLEWFVLYGNHLSGRVPDFLIQRWLAGDLFIAAESPLLTDVSEVDFEWSASSVLCARHRVILRSDRSVALLTERCRNARPDDRATFCEVREGRIGPGDYARLGWLVEKNGFFVLGGNYARNVTHGVFASTRVTRDGKSHEVVNYSDAGPFALWVIQQSIEGVASSANWEKTTTRSECLRWSEVR